MKFEEAMRLLKEGKKLYFSRPYSLVHESIYYLDKNQDFHELTYDDDENKWFDHISTFIRINYEMLTSDNWEEYNWVKEE